MRIGGHRISVVVCDLPEDTYGEFDEKKNEIRISSSLPYSQKEVTLLHELLGVLNPTLHESELGHMLMESIAQQLYQVLKHNPLNFYDAS